MLKRLALITIAIVCALGSSAQTVDFTNDDEWQVYDDWHKAYWCTSKKNYKADTAQPSADHRGNGMRDNDKSGCSAAIWCQAIYYDMAINAYRRAIAEGDADRIKKYKAQASNVYNGLKSHYVSFNFDDCNTNNGWFVYDDIMWWTAGLARAAQLYNTEEAKSTSLAKNCLSYSEKSFLRVWYGSKKVGDDGSYADPARGLPGGMYWEWQPISSPKPHQPGDFRSACINFPTIIAACLLHELVPEGRPAPTAAYPTQQTKEWYLEKAIEIYNWAQKTFVRSGKVFDGIHCGDCTYNGVCGKHKDGAEGPAHLYNQATFIGASCMLYKLTGEKKYLNQATLGVNYVFNSMCTGSQKYLPLETGYEQGVYAAIFAQYIGMYLNECGSSITASNYSKFMKYIVNNLNAGWKNRDSRGLNNGLFQKAQDNDATVESYGSSGLPALMLMFPMETLTDVPEVKEEAALKPSDVYTIDGRLVRQQASTEELGQLASGLYVHGHKKLLVK